MQVYLVGGAVRDKLLNLPVQDRDWVVVGAQAEEMLALGYESVGKDFPVFLHPKNHEEYALARTERKTAAGYHGFQFNTNSSVTLEQDLSRRDLTINAMAEDEHGHITDPYGGRHDLENGVLRHVSAAFAEDPVRILRVARFAARYDFKVFPATIALMQDMVINGEVDALVAERVWQELSRALLEPYPARFFEVLRECGALAKLLPELFELSQHVFAWNVRMLWLGLAAQEQRPISMSYSLMCVGLGVPLPPLHLRLRVPKDCADAADILQDAYADLLQTGIPTAVNMLKVFQRCDVWRRPERWQLLWQSCLLMSQLPNTPKPHFIWLSALKACLSVDTASIALSCADKRAIPEQVRLARLHAISNCLVSTQHD